MTVKRMMELLSKLPPDGVLIVYDTGAKSFHEVDGVAKAIDISEDRRELNMWVVDTHNEPLPWYVRIGGYTDA